MNWKDLDPVLKPLVEKHGLTLCTQYEYDWKTHEYRRIVLVDDSGDTYEISFTIEGDLVHTSYWDKNVRGQKGSKKSLLSDFNATMDCVYAEILDWIASRGHTRTPA